jgi:hypothetical protein
MRAVAAPIPRLPPVTIMTSDMVLPSAHECSSQRSEWSLGGGKTVVQDRFVDPLILPI